MKHILVVEASNLDTPLQSMATLEINLLDLNDNRPQLTALYSRECSPLDHNDHQTAQDPDPPIHERRLNITLDLLDPDDQEKNPLGLSARIIIRGLAESSQLLGSSSSSSSGRCLGQFRIEDADTVAKNGAIVALLRPSSSSSNQTRWLSQAEKDIESTSFVLTNVKNRLNRHRYNNHHHHNHNEVIYEIENGSSTHGHYHHHHHQLTASGSPTSEIFELFVNVELDAERQNVYEYLVELRDSGRPLGLRSFAQLLVYVDDVNDNVPKFRKHVYNFTIDEWNELAAASAVDTTTTVTDETTSNQTTATASRSVCLGKVEAVDHDMTIENSAIRYSLVEVKPENKKIKRDDDVNNNNSNREGYESSNFYIDPKTGKTIIKFFTQLRMFSSKSLDR